MLPKSRTAAARSGRGLTRRNLLASGGLAGVAAFTGIGPFKTATAQAADDVPIYLVRSTYFGLDTLEFVTTDSVRLTLDTIRDLPIAATEDKSLKDSEDAFVLSFKAAQPVADGIYTLTHPQLGKFDFHLVPDEFGGTVTATVNRSVNAPKHYPKPAPGRGEPTPGHSDEPVDDPFGTDPPEPNNGDGKRRRKRRKHLRRARLRRVGKDVVADLALDPDAHVKSAVLWLMRGKRTVATCEVERVRGPKAHARFKTDKRVPGGRYVLVVVTKDRKRRSQARRLDVTLS